MARRGIPVIDTRDPEAVSKALKAAEENFLELFSITKNLAGQRRVVPLDQTKRAPDTAPVPTGIDTTFNKDGSMTVELTWSFSQGERPATQLVVVAKKGNSPLAKPVVWEDDVYSLPADAAKARLDLPSEHNYRFGVAAARGTPDGLAVGELQAPTANPDWADIGGVDPAVIGQIVGEIDTLSGDVTLTENTWVGVASVTFIIPTWAVETKVLLLSAINLGATITTAGIFQFLWRVKRGATVLFTSNQASLDSTNGAAFYTNTNSWMDSTTLTGSVTYSLEIFKDDQGLASNAVVVKAGSQLSASHWSY